MVNDLNLLVKNPWEKWCNIPAQIKYFCRVTRWSWQRITRGFADCDVWQLDCYYATLFTESLRYLDKIRHGYPGEMTSEEWSAYLQEMAELFYRCVESNDYYHNTAFDEYWNLPDDDLRKEEMRREYLRVEYENFKKMEADKDKAFDMMKRMFFHHWD